MSSSPEFTIVARELDAAGRHYRFPIRAGWLRRALDETDVTPGEGDGELDVRASKSGSDVVLVGSVSATLVVPCARCLEPAAIPIREELGALAVSKAPQGTAPKGRGKEDDTEEDAGPGGAELLAYDGETVILDDLVRDELLLGVPMIPLCSESCAGIRPERPLTTQAASSATPVDPRLLPLLGLRHKT